MATNQTTTSYLINKNSVVTALRAVEPLFLSIESITPSGSDFVFVSPSVKQGFSLKNPKILVTKADISSFLQSSSGLNIPANSILNVKLSDETSFVEVTV